MKIIDISVPVCEGETPTWPGSPPVSLRRRLDLRQGDHADDTTLSFSVHTGTHIDAPSHFLERGKTVDELSLEQFVGPCQVVDCTGLSVIDAGALEGAGIADDTLRLLLKTDNSERAWGPAFSKSFVGLSLSAARWLSERQIRLVGIDYLSIQPFGDSDEIHKQLLRRDIAILEGLNLSSAPPGMYELLCLPLRLVGTEGAPARAILRQADTVHHG